MNHSHGSTQQITYNLIIRWTIHLAGKDDDLFDDACNLVLEELLNDAAADGTGPNDCKVCVSGHELTLSALSVTPQLGPPVLHLQYLFHSPRGLQISTTSCLLMKLLGSSAGYLGRWDSFTLAASVHENRIHNESLHGDRSNWGELR